MTHMENSPSAQESMPIDAYERPEYGCRHELCYEPAVSTQTMLCARHHPMVIAADLDQRIGVVAKVFPEPPPAPVPKPPKRRVRKTKREWRKLNPCLDCKQPCQGKRCHKCASALKRKYVGVECSEKDCSDPATTKGYCHRHYLADYQRRHKV